MTADIFDFADAFADQFETVDPVMPADQVEAELPCSRTDLVVTGTATTGTGCYIEEA